MLSRASLGAQTAAESTRLGLGRSPNTAVGPRAVTKAPVSEGCYRLSAAYGPPLSACQPSVTHAVSGLTPFRENWSEKHSDLPSGRQLRGGTPARPFWLQAHHLGLRLGGPHARTKGREVGGAWKIAEEPGNSGWPL